MNIPDWGTANPVFVDFETQSACNLKEQGGRAYVEHDSTRILILVACAENVFHVWIPDYIRTDSSNWNPANLWPNQLTPKYEVRLYRGSELPNSIASITNQHPLVAHNAYGFDRGIWNRFLIHRYEWLDSLPVARQSGRNGKLDILGKNLLGVGKDHAKKLLPKLTTATASRFGSGYSYPIINAGDLQAFTRYAIGDVEILRRLWVEFDSIKVEADVIETHNIINERGIAVDVELLECVERLAAFSVTESVNEIKRLTKGVLHEDNIRSGKQVAEWLDRYGVYITDQNDKPCLRKEVVQKFIDSPYVLEDNLASATEIPIVTIEVMKLRMKALRITDAKVKRARSRVSKDGRIRDLFTYHTAHTGRWSSSGVQIHNLPRPNNSIAGQVEHLLGDETRIPFVPKLNKQDRDVRRVFDSIKAHIPKPELDANGNPKTQVSVDDICSALIRPSFKAEDGYTFAIADFAQVEARGVAWIAGELKMLDAFKAGRDLYKEFGAKVFHVNLKDVTKDMRQIAKNAVLGCGYGLGYDKFRVYAALNGCDLAGAGITSEEVIEAYRNEYTKIAGWKPKGNESFRVGGIWKDLDKAVKECVATGIPQHAGKCMWLMQGRDLLCVLPSGRELYYPSARIEDIVPPYCYTMNLPLNPKATVVYESERGPKSLYGGLLAENVVQAICRDLLACCILQLEECGLPVVAHVHDEILCEVLKAHGPAALRQMVRIMSSVPDWAIGFPLTCEGYTCERFNKSPFSTSYKYETKDLAI